MIGRPTIAHPEDCGLQPGLKWRSLGLQDPSQARSRLQAGGLQSGVKRDPQSAALATVVIAAEPASGETSSAAALWR